MSLHPLVCADAALAASQNVQVVELLFVGEAVGTNGVKLKLIPAQSVAQARVHLAVGAGDLTGAKPTAAEVEALIKRPNGNSLSATEENIKTGLKALLDEVEVAADNAECIAFAVGGLNACEFVAAELIVTGGDTQDALVLAQTAAAVRIPEPVTLTAGKLAKAGGSGADLDTDKVVLVGGQTNGSACTVAGCFKVIESDKLVLSAANTVKLRLHIKN